MNLQNIQNYVTEIINNAFFISEELNKEQRERDEVKQKIIDINLWKQNTDVSKNVPAVLPIEGETMKYKGKTIKRKGDGRWWTRYTIKGKVYPVYGRTQQECLKKLKIALKQAERGEKDYGTATLGEWLDKWMELYKENKLKPSTLEQMHRYIKKDVAPIADKPLCKLTTMDLQEFLNSIDKPRKREKLYEYLKDALTKAVKNKLIKDNLFDGIDRPKHAKKQSMALTHEQEQLFVAECNRSNQGNLYLLCLYQGLRLGEALALTYNDIDFTKKTLTVNKSVDSLGNVTTPKTATSARKMPLFNRTEKLLEQGKSGNVFTYPRKVYQNTMLKICKRLGLDGINIHSLRHTFATRCSEAGIPAKVVQKWLGHSTLEMTLNVYTHVNADFEQEMSAKFDTFFDTFPNKKVD